MELNDRPGSSFAEFITDLRKTYPHYFRMLLAVSFAGVLSWILIDIFFSIADSIGTRQLVRIDDQIMNQIMAFRSPGLTPWIRAITNLGSAPAYFIMIPASALILFFRGHHWKLALEASIVLISSSLLNTGLKNWFSRPRPMNELHLVSVESFSYPSGHAMSAIVFYGFLIYLTFRFVSSKKIRYWALSLNLLLILAIGMSRVYLGVHYPSDVLAGWLAGLCWLIICVLILRFFHFLRNKNSTSPHLNTRN